jgi:metal-sulfur cluster biosynthetic enzyme
MKHATDEFLRAAARMDDAGPSDGGPEPIASTPADPEPAAGISGDLVWEALSTVIDPEIGLDIVTLGMVYVVETTGGTARIVHTLTTPGCPMEAAITGGIVNAVSAVPGVKHVETDLVWEPRWHPGMIDRSVSW